MKQGSNEKVREAECEIPGHGMFWEADECGRCVRDVSALISFLYAAVFGRWSGDLLGGCLCMRRNVIDLCFSFSRGSWKVREWDGKRALLLWRRWIR